MNGLHKITHRGHDSSMQSDHHHMRGRYQTLNGVAPVVLEGMSRHIGALEFPIIILDIFLLIRWIKNTTSFTCELQNNKQEIKY